MERQQENNYGQKVHSPLFPSLSLCWNLASHRHGHTTGKTNKFSRQMEYHCCLLFFSMPPPPTHVTNMPTKGKEGEEDGLYAALFAVERRRRIGGAIWPLVYVYVCVCDVGRLAYYI